MTRTARLILITILFGCLPALTAYGNEPIRIGVLAYRPKPQTLAQWQPLTAALKQAMPERDFVIEALTFPELDTAAASRQLDFVLTNPGHYVMLSRRSGLSAPLATLAINHDGQPVTVFGGVIFTRAAQTKINTLNDIKGKTIAITSADSLGGYQMQAYELKQAGIILPHDAKLVVTGMPHDTTVQTVLSGRADIGFVRTDVLENMAQENKLDLAQIKVLNRQNLTGFPYQASTQLYPEWPIASLPHIDERLARHVAAVLFLLENNTAATRTMNIYGFAVPADYTPVADLLKELRLPPFDAAPQFTLQDVLLRYRWQTIGALIAGGFILLLSFRLLLTKKKLETAHQAVLQQKQQLQESERKYSDILESVDACIYLKDTAGRYLFANRPVRELFGRPMEQIIGASDDKFFDAESAAQLRANDRSVLTDRQTLKIEESNLNLKDGKVSTYLTVKIPLINESGHVYALCGISTDITERKQSEDRLRKSEELLRESQIIASLGSYVLDIASGRWENSEALDKLFGIDASYQRSVEGWSALIHPDDRAAVEDFYYNDVLMLHKPFDMEYRIIRHNDRTERWIHELCKLEFDGQGQLSKMRGTIQDITERKQAEEKLQLAARVFTHAREGIMITAADGAIVDVNDMFAAITGYEREEVLGRNPRMLGSGLHNKDFYAALWHDLVTKGHWFGEIWNRHKNGEIYALMLTISAVRDAQDVTQHYVALFSDITAIKEHEKQLEHIAHYDALTHLPNRVLLADRLRQAMAHAQRRGQRLAVAFLDLDGFKAINDNRGHEAGDELLMKVAARMKQTLREGDTLARLGGDEFVAVLLDLDDIEASVPMLTRLLNAAAQPVQIGDQNLQVSASLGITFYPQPEDVDADQLLRQADQAMYQAKLSGKNRYHVFDDEQDRSVRGYHENIEHIRSALAEREFVLHYQPKVNMRTGEVIGAEALIRWLHPDKGLLMPGQFLPAIEHHPLSIELGEWVIDAALSQIERWHSEGLDIPVSVNIVALQLQQANFIDRLTDLLAAHPHVKPGDLEMEVLETSALEDLFKVSQAISACRKLGIRFALDDFGTGYSSLTYLKRLPITQLKIDQSFVRDMLDDPDDLAIVQGVLGLANAFYRQVLAEGVETIAHGEILLQLGCELAQGYGIARPMPAHELPGWIACWRPDRAWTELKPVSPGNLSLLHAIVEYRAWIAAVSDFANGKRDTPPTLDPAQCRFGMRLNAGSLESLIGAQAFEFIALLHNNIHSSAIELCGLVADGRQAEATKMLDSIHTLGQRLISRLESLAELEHGHDA